MIRLLFHDPRRLIILLLAFVLGGYGLRTLVPQPLAVAAQEASPTPGPMQRYLLQPNDADLAVRVNGPLNDVISETVALQRQELNEMLAEMATAGLAGPATFDESAQAFQVELTDPARDQLRQNPLVAKLQPADPRSAPTDSQLLADTVPLFAPSDGSRLEGVRSIVFIQANSPFVWGRTSGGSLSVDLTLETSSGELRGVAVQTLGTAPNNRIKVDRSLYFETIFVDPTDRTKSVMIRPGDRVRVRTSGQDPTNPTRYGEEDKRIIVDDVRAWTSYERDTVAGTANAPAGTRIIATQSFGTLNLTNYPDSTSYANLTVGPDGSFSTSHFCSSPDPTTCRRVDLKQGSTGFVRVIHPDLNEVYTIHGQNVLVLEDSNLLHGYAFALPLAPSGLLDTAVTVNRPKPIVTATLKDAAGDIKSQQSLVGGSSLPYYVQFAGRLIRGGDRVEVAINGAALPAVTVAPLTARVDLGANQVVGEGPSSTSMVVAVGRIDGFITARSTFRYDEKRLTTDGSGQFASGTFACGTSDFLNLQPGTFGYVGYEDVHGNFIYLGYAAPTTHVMSDFPYVEGRMADAALPPRITVRDTHGQIKHQSTAEPTIFWLQNQRIFDVTFHYMYTDQFILPGDRVTVEENGRTTDFTVDEMSAYLNTDTDQVTGEAAPGATVRVIPFEDRTSQKEVVAEANGRYTAANPLTTRHAASCLSGTKTIDFKPGQNGRAYVRYADGHEISSSYGRSMHAQQNENYLDLFAYYTRGLDWEEPLPPIPVTATLTSRDGTVTTVAATSNRSLNGEVKRCAPGQVCTRGVFLTSAGGQSVAIRAGDSLMAEFREGPVGGPSRPTTVVMDALALVTGSPDTETSTLAGVGPHDWSGQATLTNADPAAVPGALPARNSTAYRPLSFVQKADGKPIRLASGHIGQVSFTSFTGNRLYINWAVTSFPLRIDGLLRVGATQVCGKAAGGGTVRIYDATLAGHEIIISTGTADSQGRFCVTVNPLTKGQVILAEAGGTYSQPVVAGEFEIAFMPLIGRNG